MAKSVDEKVVQLTLDNKQFNRASDDTINSLEKLKKSLEFEGAVDAFDNLEHEIKQVDFSPMEKGIDGVGKSFTILDTITDAIFRNITNRIIDTGERMIKSLSTDQIMTGWEKYAEQTGAVQTIMAATAQQFSNTEEQMSAVNDQLEKLTWFTDETSHKFNDMVGGIGKFTANNIDLDVSVKAMEGIATWASLSGANANEASRAIYNLAQAVSVGSVKLMDWRSIENANMATTEFKQTVIETAEEIGQLVRVSGNAWKTLSGKDVSIANFSENLSDQWFTSDVLLRALDRYGNFADRLNQFVEAVPKDGFLTATAMNMIDDYANGTLDMQKAMDETRMTAEELLPWLEELGSAENDLGRRAFTAAQETKTFQEAIDYVKEAVSSGWATSFKYIFGDYLEAKEWWSEIAEVMYDAFVVGGELRNTVLSMWKDDGGRNDFLDGIRALIENVMGLVNIFKDAWNEVWFGDEADQIRNMADALLGATEGFLNFANAIKPTEETAENLRTILKSVFSILKTGLNVIKAVAKGLSPIADLLNIISGTLLQLLANAAQGFSGAIENFFNADRLNAIANALQLIAAVLSGVVQVGLATIFSILENIGAIISNIGDRIRESGGGIKGVITTLVDTVKDFFNSFLEGETIANRVADTILFIFGGLAAGIKVLIDTIVGLITGELTFDDIFSGNGSIGDAVSGFSKILDDFKIRDKLEQFTGWIKDFASELVAADGIIVQFVNNIANAIGYLWDRLGGILNTITIDDIKDLLLIAILWQFVSGLNSVNKSLSMAIGNFGGIAKSFNSLVASLTGNSPLLDKLNTMFNKSQFLQMGIAVTLLVAALGKLNTLDYVKTQQSVAALGVTLAILLAAMKMLSKILNSFPKSNLIEQAGNSFDSLAKNMLFISSSALMIAQAMKVMNESFFSEAGKFDWKRYAIIVGGVTILMTALAGVTKIMGSIDTKGVGNLVSIIAIAAGVRLIADSVRVLAKIEDIEKIVAGCLGIGAVILALGEAVNLMQKVKWNTALSTVPMILSFTTAMIAVTATLTAASKLMNWGDIGKAVTLLLTEVIALAGGIVVLGRSLKKVPPATLLSITTSMTAFSVAIIAIAGAMKVVESIDILKSGGALIALGLGFAELVAALAALGLVLQQVAPTTITAIGLSMMEMAGAVLILAGALRMIQGIDWASIQDGMVTISALILAFTLLGTAVAIADVYTFGQASEAIINLSDAFLKFAAAIGVLSASILALSLASAVVATIIAAFQALAEKVGIDLPTMISNGFDTLELILHEFLQMVQNLAPDVLAVFIMFFGMISLAIAAVKHPTATAVIGLVIAIADELAKHGQEFVDALTSIINFINNAAELFKAIEDLCYHIGHVIGAGLTNAIKGALVGIGEEILEIFGIELGGIETKLGTKFNETYNNALSKLNDGNTPELAKVEATKTMDAVIQAWSDGEGEMSDAMVIAGLQSMQAFSESTSGAMKDSVDEMIRQLVIGIQENRKDAIAAGTELGNYFREEGWIASQDPDEPMDEYKKDIFTIVKMLWEGVNGNEDALRAIGETMGFDVLGGFEDAVYSGAGIDVTRLVNGWAPKKNYKVNSKTQGAAKKAAQFLETVEEETSKDVKEEAYDYGFDVGNAGFMDGISSGIKSGTGGASKQARSAAQTIAESFSDELDKINRETQVSDKLFQLWKAQNPGASELEISAKEIEYQSEKVAIATRKAAISQEKYQQTLEAMGGSAKETHEAYIQMLDDQIAMLEAQNSLNEMMTNSKNATQMDFGEWSRTMHQLANKRGEDGRTMQEFLISLGAAPGEVFKILSEANNIAIPAAMQGAYETAKETVSETATNIVNYTVESYDAAIGYAKPVLEAGGGEMAQTLSLGFASHEGEMSETMSNAARNAVNSMSNAVNAEDIFSNLSSSAEKMVDQVGNTFTESMQTNLADKTQTMSVSIGENLDTWISTGVDNFQGIQSKEAMNNVAGVLSNELGNGLVENSEVIVTAANTMMQPTIDYMTVENVENWRQAGVSSDNGFETGILDPNAFQAVTTASLNLSTETLKAATDFLEINDGPSAKFAWVGQMIDEGLAQGIIGGQSEVINAAITVAQAALAAAKRTLGIASPSKEMQEVGKFFDLGMMRGIDNYSQHVEDSVVGMTKRLRDTADSELTKTTALWSLSDLLDVSKDDIRMTMVIDADTTAVDSKLSELEKAYLNASAIDPSYGMASTNMTVASTAGINNSVRSLVSGLDITEAYRATQLQSMYDLVASIGERLVTDATIKKSEPIEPTNVNFVQNNYSPKAISRVETYRDTQRQLDMFSRKFSSIKR